MFRAMFLPIIRSTWLYLQYLVVFIPVAAGWQPAATGVNTTRYCKYSQVLLMMGKNIVRNMLSWILCFFSNLIHFYFSFLHLQFSLHVSDRLVHHQENQITRAASGTFPSVVAISCVAVGANWVTVIWFSWWWTSRSETCIENCKCKKEK